VRAAPVLGEGAGAAEGELTPTEPEDAFAALERWRRNLPSKRQRRTEDARYLPIRLPDAGPGTSADPWQETEPFRVRRAPLPARRGVVPGLVAVALAASLTSVAVVGWDLRRHDCLHLRDTPDVRVALVEAAPGDRQCVGYSASGSRIFGDNARLTWGQRAVQKQNAEACCCSRRS